MIESVIASHTRREVSVLICESGHRWCDAARRFVGPFQHAPVASEKRLAFGGTEPLFLVEPVKSEKVRAVVQGKSSAAIVWEITSSNVAATGRAIAQIGVGRPDVLQLVGLHHDHTASLRDAGLKLMELGVGAVAESPADLAVLARLVHRRFSVGG